MGEWLACGLRHNWRKLPKWDMPDMFASTGDQCIKEKLNQCYRTRGVSTGRNPHVLHGKLHASVSDKHSHEDDQGPQREWVPRLDDEELLTSHVLLHYSSGTISRLFLVMYSGWMLKPLSTSRGYVPVHANHLRRNQWPQGLLTPLDAAFPEGLKHLVSRLENSSRLESAMLHDF